MGIRRDGREARVRADGRLAVYDGGLLAAAVRAGASLGYMTEEVAEDLPPSRLVQVLDAWCQPLAGHHIYYPSRQVTPALRSLIGA